MLKPAEWSIHEEDSKELHNFKGDADGAASFSLISPACCLLHAVLSRCWEPEEKV